MTTTVPTEFLSQDECHALFARLTAMRVGGGDVALSLVSLWAGSARWARSRMHVLSDTHENNLTITRTVDGAAEMAMTRRIDDAGLKQAIVSAEYGAQYSRDVLQLDVDPFIDQPILRPNVWSEATYRWDAAARTATAQAMMASAESVGLLAVGELRAVAQGHAVMSTQGMRRYYPITHVDCSMTVRNAEGTASGWAGVNHTDLRLIDPAAIAARAVEKCRRSAGAVAIEPGRYATILEPQAVADFFTPLVGQMNRQDAEEMSTHIFHYGDHQSKIGQQVLDARLSLRADPMDPDAGFVPFSDDDGTPYSVVTWIDRGVLRELSYDRKYALVNLKTDRALPNSRSYTLTPADGVATTSVDDMITRTERGILVTRFSGVEPMLGGGSLMVTGYTRDGIWLIEKGKIAKAVKNFRFTESPLFALNNLQDVGTSVRVFQPGFAVKAPAVRVRDFNFSHLADAV